MSNRRVLFVASVAQHLLAFHLPFVKWFQDRGFEVHAATKLGDRRDTLIDNGIVTHHIDFTRSPYSLKFGAVLKQLERVMRAHSYCLVHVHTPVAAFLGRLAARRTSTAPVLYTAHGFHFYRGAPWYNWLIFATAERIAARWTDGLIVMNGEDYKNAQGLGFEPQRNLFFVPGVGIDVERYRLSASMGAPVRESLGIAPDEVVFSCVAEFTARKNHDFLLDAWKLLSSTPKRTHLLLVGRGTRQPLLQRRAEAERLPNVHFLGARRDVPQILAATDVLVLTSKQEGLPRCIMEAMAAGKPVVATDIRGNRDLVVNRETGLLVDVHDPRGLARALGELLANEDARLAMGSAAARRAQEFAVASVVEKLGAIYQSYLQI